MNIRIHVIVFAFITGFMILGTPLYAAKSLGNYAPEIFKVSPKCGSTTGKTEVTITGINFRDASTLKVSFGALPAYSIHLISSTKLKCITPAHHAGAVNVTVSNKVGSDTRGRSYTYCKPTIFWLEHFKSKGICQLKWKVNHPTKKIVIFRGNKKLVKLDGCENSYTLKESCFGYFRYTVSLVEDSKMFDCKSVLVDFGKLSWDAPTGNVTGFFLYLAKGPGNPKELLPYKDPKKYSLDIGYVTEYSLIDLMSKGLIKTGVPYYIAISSYLITGSELLISSLTEPNSFTYEVVLGLPGCSINSANQDSAK